MPLDKRGSWDGYGDRGSALGGMGAEGRHCAENVALFGDQREASALRQRPGRDLNLNSFPTVGQTRRREFNNSRRLRSRRTHVRFDKAQYQQRN